MGVAAFACVGILLGAPSALDQALQDHWQTQLRFDPIRASQLGDRRWNRNWPDLSPERFVAELSAWKSLRARFERIDERALSAEERTSRKVGLRYIEERIAQIAESDAMLAADHQYGWHVIVQDAAPLFPYTDVGGYEDYVARLKALPEYLAQARRLLALGLQRGLVQPDFIVARSIAQCEEAAPLDPEKSPFASPILSMPSQFAPDERERLRTAILQAIRDDVSPAYRQYARFLAAEYLPQAPNKPGLRQLPNGQERYQRALRFHTTTRLTAQEIHSIGLREVRRIRARMEKLSQSMGFADIETCKRELLESPRYRAQSAEELLRRNQSYIDEVRPHLERLFLKLPVAKLEVRAIPESNLKGDVGYYDYPALDGSRPGIYWVGAGNYRTIPLLALQAIAVHEAVPGHHMQIALAQELSNLPEIRRHSDCNAYLEGWGLYAERLVEELGLFRDPVSRMGRFSQEIYRACRLVVDTGLHAMHWSRQQAIDYLLKYTFSPRANVESEVDRYVAWPGQAASYKIGELEIVRLREAAKKKLGGRFDVRKFHDRVLSGGAMPLDLLEQRVFAESL